MKLCHRDAVGRNSIHPLVLFALPVSTGALGHISHHEGFKVNLYLVSQYINFRYRNFWNKESYFSE